MHTGICSPSNNRLLKDTIVGGWDLRHLPAEVKVVLDQILECDASIAVVTGCG